jgi:hypothetical protein
VKRLITWLLAGVVVIGVSVMLVLWLRALNVNTGGGRSAPVVVASSSTPRASRDFATPVAPPGPRDTGKDSSIAAPPICSLEGDARSPRVQALNELKNRATIPSARDIDSTVTMLALLAPGNDAGRFNTRRAATISGYVADVKVGGVETVNCHAELPSDRDTHIELTLEPNDPDESTHVIVEVTPRWRAEMTRHGEDWSTAGLRRQLLGRWIHVTGWLLYDEEHEANAEHTHRGRANVWRATVWEVHPITAIQVLERPPRP